VAGLTAAASREAFSYRADRSVPPFPDDKAIIIFDGKCVLCSRWARFVLRHDHRRRFRLLAAQTSLGVALYEHYGLDPVSFETNILLEDGRAWLKSEGTIRMFERLGLPWSLMTVARVVPRALRDRLYNVVARNRLRWFGSREVCFLPDPADADRFVA
jgi:predicted DCC family thiol-disulfide oxidoreductase YuxK